MKYIDTFDNTIYPTEEEAREAILDHFDDLDFERWLNANFTAAEMFFAVVNDSSFFDNLYSEALNEYVDNILEIEDTESHLIK